MKILFATEDCLYMILIGAIVIGLSEKYFKLPQLNAVWGALFAIGIILTLLDIIHTFTDLSRHPLVLIGALANNLIDGTLLAALTAKYFNFTIPKLSTYAAQYLANPTYLFYIGGFFVVASVFWIIVWPMFD